MLKSDLKETSVSPRGELQVSAGAPDAGCPRSPGLPLRHLSAAGRRGADLCRLHRLLPVCRSAAGKLIHTFSEMFSRNRRKYIFKKGSFTEWFS